MRKITKAEKKIVALRGRYPKQSKFIKLLLGLILELVLGLDTSNPGGAVHTLRPNTLMRWAPMIWTFRNNDSLASDPQQDVMMLLQMTILNSMWLRAV